MLGAKIFARHVQQPKRAPSKTTLRRTMTMTIQAATGLRALLLLLVPAWTFQKALLSRISGKRRGGTEVTANFAPPPPTPENLPTFASFVSFHGSPRPQKLAPAARSSVISL